MCYVLVLTAFVIGWFIVSVLKPEGARLYIVSLLLGGSFLVSITALVGLILRTHWGRTTAFVAATLLLVAFPIGTALGGWFMLALARGRRLFGSDRLLHHDVEKELERRKIFGHP